MSHKSGLIPPPPSFLLSSKICERNPLIDRTQELIIPMSLRPIKEVGPLGRLVKPFRVLAFELLEELNDRILEECYIAMK